jgi:SagB-type dehydrogenase family enzyme
MVQKRTNYLTSSMIIGLITLCIIQTSVCAQNNPSDLSTIEDTLISSNAGSGLEVITLPSPDHSLSLTLDSALSERRSVRDFQNTSISQQELSNLLWAAQGITDLQTGKRTAPSGLQIYPVTLHVAVIRGTDLPLGVYSYQASGHQLVKEMDESGEQNLVAALGQKSVATAPAVIVMSGNNTPYQKFGNDMANQSMYLEAGHIAQNFLLDLSSMNLAGVPFSGFNPQKIGEVLGLDSEHPVLYGIAFGKPA